MAYTLIYTGFCKVSTRQNSADHPSKECSLEGTLHCFDGWLEAPKWQLTD